MRSYLTIDFLISLGMFFTTIIILSHIVKPITPNKAKLIVKQSEKGTSEFFKNLSGQYVNLSNDIIFNYSIIGYEPFPETFSWFTLCKLYNTTHTAICAEPPCPIKFYSKNSSPYTTSVPSGFTEISSSDIVSSLYLPMVGFFMPIDRRGDNFATTWFSDLRFYNKTLVENVTYGGSANLNTFDTNPTFDTNNPNLTIFRLSLTYTTNKLSDALEEFGSKEVFKNYCKKYGCVLYKRVVFKASPNKQYFVYVNNCSGYCLVFFNGYLMGSIGPHMGMYLPTNILFVFAESWGPEHPKDCITVVSIIDKKAELPTVSFKIYSKPSSLSWIFGKCGEYFFPNESEAIISRPAPEILSPGTGSYTGYGFVYGRANLSCYMIVRDKKNDEEIFVNGTPFYYVNFNTHYCDSRYGWRSSNKIKIFIPNGPSSSPYTWSCQTEEAFLKENTCKQSINYLEQPSRIEYGNDLLDRITFYNLIYSNTWLYPIKIERVILLFRSDDGADVWLNGVKLLNRIHDNHPATDSLYGLVITRSNYTKLWVVTWGPISSQVARTEVVNTPNLFRPGSNVLAIWVANGGDDNWGSGYGDLAIEIFRIYEKLDF